MLLLAWKKEYMNQHIVFYISTDRGLKPFRFCGDRGGNENKCSNEDGGTICYCDTDLCNSEPIKCIVNGDYERKNNPKQTEPFAKECPIGVTHCITVSGKITEGNKN